MKLETTIAFIVPIAKGHFADIIEMYNEPDSNKYIAPLRNKTREEYLEFLTMKIDKNQKELGFWSVYSKDTDEFIGTINLNFFDKLSFYHVGSHLRKQYWNKGYSTELLNELIRYGFQTKGLQEIHGVVQVGNEASEKLMQKLGFTFAKQVKLEDDLRIFKINKA